MAINSADDETNPPGARLDRPRNRTHPARQIRADPGTEETEETHGHFTHLRAKFWKPYVAEFLKDLPPRQM